MVDLMFYVTPPHPTPPHPVLDVETPFTANGAALWRHPAEPPGVREVLHALGLVPDADGAGDAGPAEEACDTRHEEPGRPGQAQPGPGSAGMKGQGR